MENAELIRPVSAWMGKSAPRVYTLHSMPANGLRVTLLCQLRILSPRDRDIVLLALVSCCRGAARRKLRLSLLDAKRLEYLLEFRRVVGMCIGARAFAFVLQEPSANWRMLFTTATWTQSLQELAACPGTCPCELVKRNGFEVQGIRTAIVRLLLPGLLGNTAPEAAISGAIERDTSLRTHLEFFLSAFFGRPILILPVTGWKSGSHPFERVCSEGGDILVDWGSTNMGEASRYLYQS